MGYLKGYNKISAAADHDFRPISLIAFLAFQNECCNLIIKAYKTIYSPSSTETELSEPNLSANLSYAMELIASKEKFPCSIVTEPTENTDEILSGKVSVKKSKKYDIYLCSLDGADQVSYGIEAKLLLQNNYLGRNNRTLNKHYISSVGMRKFIDHIYKKRGCMLGYAMEGDPEIIVKNINNEILESDEYTKDIKETLHKTDLDLDYEYCYESEHAIPHVNEKLFLRHLILKFS